MKRMRLIAKIVVSIVLLFISCSSEAPQKKAWSGNSVESLLTKGFAALKAADIGAYSQLTITSADFVLKKMGIPKFKQSQSYVGSSMKPAEIKKQNAQFQKAVAGEEDNIMFKSDEFVSIGSLIKKGVIKAMNNTIITFEMYSFKIKTASGETHDDLFPYVMVVKWGSYYHILKLMFTEP
jgi:hypothetical protein